MQFELRKNDKASEGSKYAILCVRRPTDDLTNLPDDLIYITEDYVLNAALIAAGKPSEYVVDIRQFLGKAHDTTHVVFTVGDKDAEFDANAQCARLGIRFDAS